MDDIRRRRASIEDWAGFGVDYWVGADSGHLVG